MDIVNPQVEEYMGSLQARHDEPVLLEMEKEGRERGFPIVGRNVGVTLEVLARSINARRVMELGSGFGYSAYWFARAVGDSGEVYCTDGDPDNAALAETYLETAGVWDRVRFRVRSEEHTSELQSHVNLVCRLLLEKKKTEQKRL